MKIYFNNIQVFELSDIQEKVILNDIPSEVWEGDATRRCKYWLEIPVLKWATRNEKSISKKLVEKGSTQLPAKAEKRALLFAEEYPCKCGYKDIKSSIACKAGLQTFDFSVDHRKLWRKMLQPWQEVMSEAKYFQKENKVFEDRLGWILKHKYERCLARLHATWDPILESRGFTSFPADEDEYATLVFSQSDYKDRSQRDAEEKERLGINVGSELLK